MSQEPMPLKDRGKTRAQITRMKGMTTDVGTEPVSVEGNNDTFNPIIHQDDCEQKHSWTKLVPITSTGPGPRHTCFERDEGGEIIGKDNSHDASYNSQGSLKMERSKE